MEITKRDGRKVKFNKYKIYHAIENAAKDSKTQLNDEQLESLTNEITDTIMNTNNIFSVEDIQQLIETILSSKYPEIAKNYKNYRKERTNIRELKSDIMTVIKKIGVETDRDNANVGNNFSSKLLRIASESNKWTVLANMPKDLAKAHESGDIYHHDLDSYNLTTNCLHIPTARLLTNGFNTGYGTITPPKRIESAAELSCILLQASQNDLFGGQSHPNFDNALGLFVEPTRKEIIEELKEDAKEAGGTIATDIFNKKVMRKLKKRVHQAMQAIVYNLNSMHSRAGSQVPFSSINLGLPENEDAALVCEAFLEEYEKGLGKGEQPIFPNIIFRVKKGLNRDEQDPYFYLYKIACRVAAKRMNPTFMNMDADFNKKYYDKGIIPATMGCRTYVCSNINGQEGPEGRGNIAPVTVNLPRLGILAHKSAEKLNTEKAKFNEVVIKIFFELLEDRLELAKKSLLHRYSVLKKLKVKDLPFSAGQGLMLGSEGLGMDDSIEPILKQGSWSIGFIGLAETLTALIGVHHGESAEAEDLAKKIVSFFREFTDKATTDTHLNWSTYATPAEGLSGKFIDKDKKLFGKIKGVTDKDYYTNSYHIPVGFAINIKEKIRIEAPFHKLCNAGHITYIELDTYPEGETLMDITNWAYDNTNISYLAYNFHMRYCKDCGNRIYQENSCPKCGSHNIQGVSRITGYLSLDERFGHPKAEERKDRISHTTFKKVYGK